MQHGVDRTGHVHEVGHVAAEEAEPVGSLQVADVGGAPGEQVVEADDLDALGDQPRAQVRSEEPGAAGHHDAAHLARRTRHRDAPQGVFRKNTSGIDGHG